MPSPKIIVIAWTVIEQLWDGKPFAHDLGRPAGMVDVTQARAVVWLLEGDDSDVVKARKAAEQIDPSAQVYTFGQWHKDPLGAARDAILSKSA